MAGPLGRRPHVLGAEPGRTARRRRGRAHQAQAVRARHVPVPEWRRPPRRPPARVHRHRRVRALHAHERSQRVARDGLRRVRSARPSSTRSSTVVIRGDHRRQRRQHAPAAARTRARARLASQRRHHRPAVLPLDAVDLPADLQLVVRRGRCRRSGPRSSDRGADRGARVRRARADERCRASTSIRTTRRGAISTRPPAAR